MVHNIQDIEIKQLSSLNDEEIAILKSLLASDTDELIESYDTHRIEHGVAPGGIYLPGSDLVGIGGFLYIEETSLYEVVCHVLDVYEEDILPLLHYFATYAFDNLKMDKICARAIPGSVLDDNLANSRFTFSGERMFIQEQDGQLWNYYELEDEGNLVSAESTGIYSDNDWDAFF